MSALAINPVPSATSDPTAALAQRCLYFMKMMREIEDRIERKLYRQGKILSGVYVGRGQEAGYKAVNARTSWDAGVIYGYGTDTGYLPKAGLEHELNGVVGHGHGPLPSKG